MKTKDNPKVSYIDFLNIEGRGRKLIHLKATGIFFSQGTKSNSIFYLTAGRAKLTVVSKRGKEATITLLVPGEFIGEESVASTGRSAHGHHLHHYRLHLHEDQS